MGGRVKFSPPLRRGRLVRRYKRFLADVDTCSGERITIHCPNTGSMKNCADPGNEVFYSTSSNATRKYAHTWELTRTRRGHYIGVNTGRANEIVKAGIEDGTVAELNGYASIRREVGYGRENSRIDLLLTGHGWRPDCYVEVKSVTLLETPIRRGIGYFPDAVSRRGTRHLRELSEVVRHGERGVLLFCVQHSGIREVRPAAHIDPEYAAALVSARAAGVEVLAYKTRLSSTGLRMARALPVVVGP